MNNTTQGKHDRVVHLCAYCKKNLRGQEVWASTGDLVVDHNNHELSHGICTACLYENFPYGYLVIQEEKKAKIRNVFNKGYKDLYGHLAG